MRKTSKSIVSAARIATGLFGLFVLLDPASAQSPAPNAPDTPSKEREKGKPRRDGGNQTPEQRRDPAKPDGKHATPSPDVKDGKGGKDDKSAGADQPAADPQAKLSRPPQTREEKARRLADLYAQLATAEDEETAKRHASAIERLWMQSGSDTVSLLLERATQAMKKKKTTLAEKLLDHVVALAPDYAEGFNQRAYLHFTQNNYEAAVGDLRRVLALDPNHYKALEGLAQIWRETGNKKGAYGVMKQLMEVHPFASGAKAIYEELKRETDGQGI